MAAGHDELSAQRCQGGGVGGQDAVADVLGQPGLVDAVEVGEDVGVGGGRHPEDFCHGGLLLGGVEGIGEGEGMAGVAEALLRLPHAADARGEHARQHGKAPEGPEAAEVWSCEGRVRRVEVGDRAPAERGGGGGSA